MDLYGRDTKRRRRDDGGAASSTSNIAASSFLDLKAQLAGRREREQAQSSGKFLQPKSGRKDEEDEYSRQRLPAHLRHVSSSSSSSSSSPSSSSRSKHRDRGGEASTLSSWAETPSARLERDRKANLARKAKLYDELRRGLSGGLKPEDLEEGGKMQGLLDWDRMIEERRQTERDEEVHRGRSDDEGEEDQQGGDSRDLVEYEDDMGRTRLVPRSQVPMEYLVEQRRRKEEGEADAQGTTLYGPQAQFPIMTRGDVPKEPGQDAQHFDASHEVRNRGAGFFRFDQDEGKRKEQMEALRKKRDETLRRRGNVSGEGGETAGGRTMNKAEERLEARRRFVAAKTEELRRKGGQAGAANDPQSSAVDHFLNTLSTEWAASQ